MGCRCSRCCCQDLKFYPRPALYDGIFMRGIFAAYTRNWFSLRVKREITWLILAVCGRINATPNSMIGEE